MKGADCAQNALDIFRGEWACSMPAGSGLRAGPPGPELSPEIHVEAADSFRDIRIDAAEQGLGGFAGRTALEIGPCEGAQTYCMCERGARSVTAVESNPRAFLKCLIVKEVLGLSNARFLLGDAVEYLRRCADRYDVAVASGVLYHMRNPLEFLELISRVSDRLFLWTHYYDYAALNNQGLEHAHFNRRTMKLVERGVEFVGYRHSYDNVDHPLFLGGTEPYSCWMTRDDILRALELFGFSKLEVGLEQPDHANGPAFCVCATRERSEGPVASRSELGPAPAPRAEATGPEAVAESDPAGAASARTPIPVPVHRPISYIVRCPVAALREVEVAIGSFGNISVEGSVELAVRDDATGTLLRHSTVSFKDLRGWRIFSFEFDVVEGLNGKALRLTFEPRTDGPVALLELSRRCLSLRRRLLRKLGLDRTGDDLRCVLR